MNQLLFFLRSIEAKLVKLVNKIGIDMLRISIGLIYLLFGFLKFLPTYSPAEQLATQTIESITFGVVDGRVALVLLALIECGIGLSLIFNKFIKGIILLSLWHMACTFFPLILLPEVSFTQAPYSLSLVGQYILKNLVIIAGLMLVYSNSHRKENSV